MKNKSRIIKCDFKTAAAAIIATAVMLILISLAVSGEGMISEYLIPLLILGFAAGLFLLLNISYGNVTSVLIYLVFPPSVLWALENYTHVIEDLAPMILGLNLLFFYLLFAVCIFLTGSIKSGMTAGILIPMIFGLANYFVVQFRGNPILPWDFLSIGTALSVADNYEFVFTWKVVISLVLFIWLILIASKSSVVIRNWKIRLTGLIVSAALFFGYISAIQNADVQTFFGMDKTLFTLNVMYRNNGIAGGFLGNLQYLNIKEPEGYSEKAVKETAGIDKFEEETSETLKDSEMYPNIIVIMNEAFSDLSVWGEYTTNQEVMPFFKSLQEEGVGGELYVSVKGGNTANSEYEFLTGDTMAFLPAGCVPYQQYLNTDMPGLTSYLKKLGYQTLAIHPYNRSGWDRDEVYEYFGFDEYLDKDAFDNPHRMRGYISDRSAFEKIVEQFEWKPEGCPMFVFEVTMQNHGGYSKETPDFDTYIEFEDFRDKTLSVTSTEKYLTLMNESDKALKELIQYFKSQDEPTVVLMFGDHQPSEYITNAIQRVCGSVQGNSLEEQQKGYRVPFAIWSNQKLEHAYYDGISLNYLSSILLDAAGVPLTGYQKWLKELMQTLPITSGLVYADHDGNLYSYEDDTYNDLLNQYRILQYNHLTDWKNRLDGFFD